MMKINLGIYYLSSPGRKSFQGTWQILKGWRFSSAVFHEILMKISEQMAQIYVKKKIFKEYANGSAKEYFAVFVEHTPAEILLVVSMWEPICT